MRIRIRYYFFFWLGYNYNFSRYRGCPIWDVSSLGPLSPMLAYFGKIVLKLLATYLIFAHRNKLSSKTAD